MRDDLFVLDALGSAIAQVTYEFGVAIDDDGNLLDASAVIHPHDCRDAADALLSLLERHGLAIREVPSDGNSLGTRMLRLAVELSRPDLDAARIRGIRNALCGLAVEARERDDAMVPLHLRLADGDLPQGVVQLNGRRARS